MNTETTVRLTDSAVKHVKKVLAMDGTGIGLRIGVKSSGCSGYQYIVETAQGVDADDETIEANGVKIIIDKNSLPYLAGMVLDFSREGLNSGLQFQNPNVQDSCGCGKSVNFKAGLEK